MQTQSMDPSIAGVLCHEEQRRRAQAWDELCTRDVWPTIESVLKRKFGLSAKSSSRDEDDFNTVLVEAFAAVHGKLAALEGGYLIGSLEAYATTTASRAFTHFLRTKYPARARLRSQIVFVCKSDQRIDRWRYRDSAMVTGRTKWKDEAPSRTRNAMHMLEQPREASQACYGPRDPAAMLVPDAMLHFFDWVPGPVEFDPLVNFLRSALRRDEMSEESSDGGNTAEARDYSAHADDAVAVNEILSALWEELEELEVERRGVYLLFEPPGTDQDPLIDVIIAGGLRNLNDIAEFVGMDAGKLAELISSERVELKRVADIYGLEVKRAEGVRRAVTERLARRFEARGLYRPMQRRLREAT